MPTDTLSVDQVRADLDSLGIDLAFKSAPAAVVAGGAAQALSVEETADKGRVRAIVSVTGVEDSVRDIIAPGAYTKTLKDRKPKVCWHHSWEKPIGRTESIEEWLPGDSRLPKQTKDGKPWPAKAGALVADMVFNLKSDRGREAFEAVRFYTESNECEWSIGYNVPPGAATKDKAGVRHIKSLDLYELSFVLFGAAPLSMTLDLKSADLGQIAQEWRDEQGDDAPELKALALHRQAEDGIDWAEVKAALPGVIEADEDGIVAVADWRPEVGRLVTLGQRKSAVQAGAALPDGTYPIEDEHDLRAALAHVEAKGIADEPIREHVARAAVRLNRWDLIAPAGGLEAKAGAPGVADTPGDRASVARLKEWYVSGEGAAQIRWGTDGDFMRCVRIAGKHMDPEKAKGFCNLRHRDATGAAPGHAAGETAKKAADVAAEVKAKGASCKFCDAAATKKVTGSDSAVMVCDKHVIMGKKVTGKGPSTVTKIGATEAKKDAALEPQDEQVAAGNPELTPADEQTPAEPVDTEVLTADEVKAMLAEVGLELPQPEVKDAGVELTPEPVPAGLVEDEAPAADVEPEAPAEPEAKAAEYDPTLEISEPEVETKAAAPISGSYEERIREVDEELRETLLPQLLNGRDGFLSIDATFPDRVVATVYDTRSLTADPQTYEVRYVMQGGEAAIVGTPVKVELSTTVTYASTEQEPAEAATAYAKALIEEAGALYRHTHAQEVKAGRVLSSVNAKRLSGAVESLIAILAAAGVEVSNPTKADIEAESQIQDNQSSEWDAPPDSTSVAASRPVTGKPGKKDGMEVLTAAEVKALLAEVGMDDLL